MCAALFSNFSIRLASFSFQSEISFKKHWYTGKVNFESQWMLAVIILFNLRDYTHFVFEIFI